MIDIHIVLKDGRPMGGWAGRRTATEMARLAPGMTVETVVVPDVLFAVTETSAQKEAMRKLYDDDFTIIAQAIRRGPVPDMITKAVRDAE